jgi:hypothetical protein
MSPRQVTSIDIGVLTVKKKAKKGNSTAENTKDREEALDKRNNGTDGINGTHERAWACVGVST